MKKVFIYIFRYFKMSVDKRIYSFFKAYDSYLVNKKKYFLNLIGYNDKFFKKFIKIIFLYFFFKFFFDLIYLILYGFFEIYLIFLEVFFNILFDFRIILRYFSKYYKIFFKIDIYYYKIVSWFYLLFSFNKIKFYKIKRFILNFSLFKILDSFYRFISYLLWFIFTRKETKKYYLKLKKLIINTIGLCLNIIATVYSVLAQIIYLNGAYFYFYHLAKTSDFYDWPKAKTKKRVFLKILVRYLRIFLRWLFKKVFYFVLDGYKFIRLKIKKFIENIKNMFRF